MTYTKALILSFIVTIISFTAHAQESSSIPNSEKAKDTTGIQNSENKRTTWQMIKYDGASIFGGVKHAYTRPFTWKEKDWATFGILIAGSTALLGLDDPAKEYFANQEKDIPDGIKEVAFRFGKPLINYGLTTSVYALGLITKNKKIRKTGVLLIASATAGGLLQTAAKTFVGRARPLTGEGNLSFRFYSGGDAAYHSFPSGHTILSVTTAYAIGKQFKNPFLKGGIYAIGLLSPVSRLWSEAHWLTDVALGSALSIIIVESIDNYLTKDRGYAYANKHKIKWNLRVGANQIGVVGRF